MSPRKRFSNTINPPAPSAAAAPSPTPRRPATASADASVNAPTDTADDTTRDAGSSPRRR